MLLEVGLVALWHSYSTRRTGFLGSKLLFHRHHHAPQTIKCPSKKANLSCSLRRPSFPGVHTSVAPQHVFLCY
jgi:hypothetical protein